MFPLDNLGKRYFFLAPLSHKMTIHLVHEWDEMSRNGSECHQTNKPFINIYCPQMCNSQCLNVVWFYLFHLSRWTSSRVCMTIARTIGDLREVKRHPIVNQNVWKEKPWIGTVPTCSLESCSFQSTSRHVLIKWSMRHILVVRRKVQRHVKLNLHWTFPIWPAIQMAIIVVNPSRVSREIVTPNEDQHVFTQLTKQYLSKQVRLICSVFDLLSLISEKSFTDTKR